MRYHTQNLNERKLGQPNGSMIWHGRGWLYTRREIHWEWALGKFARGWGAYTEIGAGENDDGLMVHVCVPFIFSIFLGIAGVKRCKQGHKTGFAVHNGGFWTYIFTNENDSSRDDPWWAKHFCWHFPWTLDWYSTEILEHKAFLPKLQGVAYREDRKTRRIGKDPFESMRQQEPIKMQHSQIYQYRYVLKSGEVQERAARVYVDRMTWRARWWPIIPISKIRTSINIDFNGEVGEGTGSWKGGCTGCGYEMHHGETPKDTIMRMEKERKFDR